MGVETELISMNGFSFFHIFLKADYVVKSVMVILVLASIASWAIIIDKFFGFWIAKHRKKQFEHTFWSGMNINELKDKLTTPPRDAFARIFASAIREWEENRKEHTTHDVNIITAQMRLQKLAQLSANRDLEKLGRGIGFLAIIASSSPFIGLLGTVWGIMNAFRSIAVSQNTNLAVVAPGIAEALFATALGLFAAIPALIFYNILNGRLSSYAFYLESYSDELCAILSRRMNKGETE